MSNRSAVMMKTPPSDDAPHLLVVDDDKRIRDLLNRYLTEQGFRITIAADAAEARRKLEGLHFDLIILDVMMPGESGLSLTKSLYEKKTIPVILLTARVEAESRIAGLEAGADDYLAKPFDPRELVLRINNILRRSASETPKIEQVIFGPFTFSVSRKELRRAAEIIRLTDREQEIMLLFALRAGDTIPRHELIGDDSDVGERTIDVQINRLRRKIEEDPANPVYLQTVRGIGYRMTSLGLPGWRPFTRWLRRRLPTGLYTRSLLIVILPMLLLQTVVAAVFMERHWRMVTERLSEGTTRDIAGIIEVIRAYPQDSNYDEITRIADQALNLTIAVEEDGELPPPRPRPFFSILDGILTEQITRQIKMPFWLDTVGDSRLVEIRIKFDERVLRVFVRRGSTYASNTHIFLAWMIGTAIVLVIISILFLRGQIRPILSLAAAAESFGKGQKTEGFSPRGADEIRRAGLAFIQMRERIERQMEQRTAMLAGISHDLRTILTRFKLQLALAGDKPELSGMSEDVDDMQSMLEGYLAFAKGEAEEDFGTLRLTDLLERFRADFSLRGRTLTFEIDGEDEIAVRPNAFTRLVANLVSNSERYATNLHISARHSAKWLTLTLDDDGPGIPAEAREDVFKPFYRLDEARNLNDSGTGLGLAIARDIARAHGGNVTLADSPSGGLRAVVRVPA
eukprot:g7695.t1